jgi:hypothetical protein
VGAEGVPSSALAGEQVPLSGLRAETVWKAM